jgi:hypothetical protein
MTFNIGERVKWKERGTYLRLSFPGADTGTVVSVNKYSGEGCATELDIRFDNGEIVRGVADYRFEKVTADSEH